MATLAQFRTPEGFYVFHERQLPGQVRATDDAIMALLNSGRPIPRGTSMTPTAYAAYQQFQQGMAQPPAQPEAAQQFDDGGGGGGSDGGGSGSGGAGGFVRPTLASSPEWMAYLNSLGLEENQFRADIDRQRGLAQSAADFQIQALGPQYQRQRQGISGSLESRGMTSSGEYLRRIAESRQQQGTAQAGIQTNLAGQIGGLESQLANRLIDIGSRRAERELQLRTGGYQ